MISMARQAEALFYALVRPLVDSRPEAGAHVPAALEVADLLQGGTTLSSIPADLRARAQAELREQFGLILRGNNTSSNDQAGPGSHFLRIFFGDAPRRLSVLPRVPGVQAAGVPLETVMGHGYREQIAVIVSRLQERFGVGRFEIVRGQNGLFVVSDREITSHLMDHRSDNRSFFEGLYQPSEGRSLSQLHVIRKGDKRDRYLGHIDLESFQPVRKDVKHGSHSSHHRAVAITNTARRAPPAGASKARLSRA